MMMMMNSDQIWSWIINANSTGPFFILHARDWGRGRNPRPGSWERLRGGILPEALPGVAAGNTPVWQRPWVSQVPAFPTGLLSKPPSDLAPGLLALSSGRSKAQRPDGTSGFSSLILESVPRIRNWILKWSSPVPPWLTGLTCASPGFQISQVPKMRDTGSPLRQGCFCITVSC